MNSPTLNGDRIIQKIKWRIIPFAFILYFFNGMDRVNVGYAALQMNKALQISSAAFGMITSGFFISYLLFQVPSNILSERVGINKLIPSLTIVWGAITALTFFSQNATQVTLFRFLLGIAEAGFFPGMILYFTYWFPAKDRAQVTSLFMLSGPISGIVASPISGWIVQNCHFLNHDGWRWLFAIEGVPTIILGFLAFFLIKNSPKDVNWLNDDEKEWLKNELQSEKGKQREKESLSFGKIISNGMMWKLACIYMFVQASTQAAMFWLPGLVKGFSSSFSDSTVGLIMMIPNVVGAIAMPIWASHSDKTKERKYHAAVPMLLLGMAFIMFMLPGNLTLRLISLGFYGLAFFSFYGPYWTFPPALLTPEIIAVAIAVINSCSSLGGFGGNILVGQIAGKFGTTGVFLFLAVLCFVSFVLTITLPAQNSTKSKA